MVGPPKQGSPDQRDAATRNSRAGPARFHQRYAAGKAVLGSMLALILIGSAPAATPDWSGAERIEINLSNFKFTPSRIELRPGGAYLLHLSNTSSGGHNFSAKEFFAAATVAPEDQARIVRGAIEMSGGEQLDIRLIAPPAGTYPLHCGHFMHSVFGMKGVLVVQ